MMSGEEQFSADIELTQQGSHAHGMEELSENDPPEIDEFEIPEGEQYSLVSKRLKAVRIQIGIGLASFYRKFVPNFARIAEPLHNLTRKNVPFEWTASYMPRFLQLLEEKTG